MARRTPLLLAAVVACLAPRASARCDYRVGGKCCTGANSHGAPGLDLLTSRVTVSKQSTTADGGYVVDLRLDLRFLETDDDLWWPVTWGHLVESHGREIHVFLVHEDLGSVWHVHGQRGQAHSDLERACVDRGVWYAEGGGCDWVAEDPEGRCGLESVNTGERGHDGCPCACNTQFAEFFYARDVALSVGGTYRVLVTYVVDADSLRMRAGRVRRVPCSSTLSCPGASPRRACTRTPAGPPCTSCPRRRPSCAWASPTARPSTRRRPGT